jgi:transposase-like protein
VAILREGETGDRTIEPVCRSPGIGPSVFDRWRKQFGTGGHARSEGRRVKELEVEQARYAMKRGLSERASGTVVQVPRSMLRDEPRRPSRDAPLRAQTTSQASRGRTARTSRSTGNFATDA